MPFRKPKRPTFRVVTFGSGKSGEAPKEFFQTGAGYRRRSYVRKGGHLEIFTVETKLPNLLTVRLEFTRTLLEDSQNLPAPIYFHPAHFLLTIQDVLHHRSSEMDDASVTEFRLFELESGGSFDGDIARDVMEERRGTSLKCEFITSDVMKQVIQIISNFLVIHRLDELESFREEMTSVNLQHDKTSLTNSTMCYERNSIG